MAPGEPLNRPPPDGRCAACAGADPALPSVADIDWSAPWLSDWRGRGEPLAGRIAAGESQPEVLNLAAAAPVTFVPQAELPAGVAYEAYIHATGRVPTREGLHDFFNALCWMHFPRAKQQLNRLQAAEIGRAGVGQVRGAVRDAATVFDENAVLIQTSDSLWQALSERRWRDAMVLQRAQWTDTRLWMFGHAALEKLVRPYKSITVHLWRVPAQLRCTALDDWLANDLSAAKLAGKPFTPLPVLGVPQWWAPNADPAFYDDPLVFRPPRRRESEKPYAAQEMTRPA